MSSVRSLAVPVTLAAGLGVLVSQGISAQTKAPVYFIADIESYNSGATDRNAQRSNKEAAKNLKDFGGHYLARTNDITALDGTKPARTIIISFESVEKARAWYNSQAQKPVNEIRIKEAKSRSFIVPGM